MKSPYASFTRRAFARFIDLIIVLSPCLLLFLIDWVLGFPIKYRSLFTWKTPTSVTDFIEHDFAGVFTIFISIKLLIAFPYFALFESSRWQGTLGKLAADIKVTDTDGHQISLLRAAARFLMKGTSAVLLMLGYVVSFSDRRQTWHDFITRTLVLRRKVFPQYYAMPRVASRWMFSLPGAKAQTDEVPGAVFECIFCDYRGNKDIACPNCGRLGYASHGVMRGMLMMNGLLFAAIGSGLGYITYFIIIERLQDDSLGREGAPWPVIFIVFTASALCLSAGISSIVGKKWLLRLMLYMFAGRIPR